MQLSKLNVIRCSSLVLLVLMLSACSKPDYQQAGITLNEETSQSVRNLANTMLLSAEDRLAVYTEEGHLRVLAYNSMDGLKVPGFTQQESKQVVDYFGVELVPAMGDQLFSDEHRKLQLYFIDYAARYNRLLIIQEAQKINIQN